MLRNKNAQNLVKRTISAVVWLEIVLAVFIIIGVLISSVDIIRYIRDIFINDTKLSYDLFQGFLSHILLLVVGLELARVLLRHTPGSVLEVMLYAIARKMLIHSNYTYELLIGVLALAAIFFIDKYLHSANTKYAIDADPNVDE